MTDVPATEEERERQHLAETLRPLNAELGHLSGYIDKSARTIDERKQHLWDNLRDMDFAEKAHFRHEMDLRTYHHNPLFPSGLATTP